MNNIMNGTAAGIYSADTRAQYDNAVKRLLSDRQILARILQRVVREYKCMEVEDIIPCIDPPYVSTVPVDPGLTNLLVVGENTESSIPGEGVSYFDIRFTASVPGTEERASVNLTVDVEAQKKPNPGYDLATRGIYYCGRMLSDQNGRIFSGHKYDDIQKVYSIWIVMNCPQKTANTISGYRVAHEALHGDFEDDARSDLIEVIMIRLPEDGKSSKAQNQPTRLHSMLSELLSAKPAEEKCSILEQEYGVTVSQEHKEEMNVMCNLSEMWMEKGLEEGLAEGLARGGNIKLYELVKKGLLSVEDAAADMDVDVNTFIEKAAEYGISLKA